MGLNYDELSDCSDMSSLPPSSPRSSPGPESRYPSPSSQLEAEFEQSAAESSARQARPAKRRRNPLPKERTTQYLDLSKSLHEQSDQHYLLVQTLRHQKDVVVIAGAGISTAAGIPDFRSSDGLFRSLQQKHGLKSSGKLLFDAAVYRDDALTAPFHEMVRSLSEDAQNTKPTAFHRMLARLGTEGRLKRLYTQNIDGIETQMKPLATDIPLNIKGNWPVTIQLHGSIEKMVCQKCRFLTDFNRDMFTEADPPLARSIGGLRSHGIGRMRPRIVLYNEHNPDEEAITSVMNADVKSRPRVLIVAGTSLKIPGVRRLVKSMCSQIRSRKDGVTMFVNNEPPTGKEFADCFDLIVQGSCDEVANQANLKCWESSDNELCEYESSPEPMPQLPGSLKVHASPDVSVVITPTKKRTRDVTGLLSPPSGRDEQPAKKRATKATKANATANPASRGPSITDLLKGQPKAASKTAASSVPKAASKPAAKQASKPATKKPAATTTAKRAKKTPAPVKPDAKLTAFKNTRVTKNSRAAATDSKLNAKIMCPVPPGDPKNNGTLDISPVDSEGKPDMADINLDSVPTMVS
ncbi:Sirtuin family [Penicillium brevicompactum]|uniref:Sirtuin family n=1 Tax=Penicillium brevicompactum TaxID=5074 RepID=A0A9W9Q9M5_PENBR|nr:Sirtuin family [Penicillium brevicompactum]